MSWGMCICSECKHEVHQSGDSKRTDKGWEHCDVDRPICAGATAIYAQSLSEVKGKWCGMDGNPAK